MTIRNDIWNEWDAAWADYKAKVVKKNWVGAEHAKTRIAKAAKAANAWENAA